MPPRFCTGCGAGISAGDSFRLVCGKAAIDDPAGTTHRDQMATSQLQSLSSEPPVKVDDLSSGDSDDYEVPDPLSPASALSKQASNLPFTTTTTTTQPHVAQSPTLSSHGGAGVLQPPPGVAHKPQVPSPNFKYASVVATPEKAASFSLNKVVGVDGAAGSSAAATGKKANWVDDSDAQNCMR